MRLNKKELRFFYNITCELVQHEKLQEMRNYIQHGDTSTFIHCITVAYFSYLLARRLRRIIRFDLDAKSLIRGALLHDFYLYDWHIPHESHKLHGFRHPVFALNNSRKYFKLNKIEEDIIEKHMWPLTFTRVPRFKEAFLVCMIDKYCSLAETFYIPLLPKPVLSYIKVNFMQDIK